MINDILTILLIILIPSFAVFAFFYQKEIYRESKKEIFIWANRNEYEIVEIKRKFFSTQFYEKSKSQALFYLRLLDSSKNQKEALVLCGGKFDPLKKEIEVKWQEKKS